jgi:cytosine/adenosine deaminase-related metal-dependent hydrolase
VNLRPLINAHTHLELGGFAHLLPPSEGSPFVAWIQTLIAARRAIANDGLLPYQKAVEAGIAALRETGVTTVGDISATGVSVEPLLDSGLSGIVYLEVLGLEPTAALQRLREAQAKIDAYRKRENAMRLGLTIHAPYSCHPDLFREGAKWCVAENVPLCVHIAESKAETELLQHGAGDFLELARTLKLPEFPVPRCSPVAYLQDLGVLEAKPLLVHCVQVDEADIQRIARSGSKVVHCPRSNQRLQCGRMPLEKFLAAGVRVALGTDSLTSSPSLDIRHEAEAAVKLHTGLVPSETIYTLLISNSLISNL